MRKLAVAFAAVGLVGCMKREEDPAKPEAKPVVLAYEGANATDPAAVLNHGARLSDVLSCSGCHGGNLQGKNVTADDPAYGDMNAPNLTLAMATYSDADFIRLMREGVPKDGREFWFMPVESFSHLSEPDMAALLAHLRSFKPAGKQLPPIRKGKGFAQDIERGFTNATSQIARARAASPVDLGSAHAQGRYIAMTTCTACHNNQLQGYDGFAPNLDIAGSYTAEELTHLLTTGEGKVKKNLGLMSAVARDHFSKLTAGERAAVVTYIKARADRAQ